jgi:hypothetical protein
VGSSKQVLRLARELAAPRVGRVALDGSKIKANASKHKAMSYGRMPEKQRQLRDEVTDLRAQAEPRTSPKTWRSSPIAAATNCRRSCNGARVE